MLGQAVIAAIDQHFAHESRHRNQDANPREESAEKPPQGNDAKCGFTCHTMVKAGDSVFDSRVVGYSLPTFWQSLHSAPIHEFEKVATGCAAIQALTTF